MIITRPTSAEARQGLVRRAFLAGLATTVPIAAIASGPALAASDDVGQLVALRARYRELLAQLKPLVKACDEATKRWRAACQVAPDSLLIRKADLRLLKEFSRHDWHRKTHFDEADIRDLRQRPALRWSERPIAIGQLRKRETAPTVEPIGDMGIDYDVDRQRVPWPLAQRRKDAIVAAFDQWQANKNALHSDLGVADADEALEDHQRLVDQAFDAMIAAPARTIAALKFKAGLMEEWAGDPEDDPFEDFNTIDLMRAIVFDLANQ